MKILVCSDLHGMKTGADAVERIYFREKPDRTVICGDVYGGFGSDRRYVAQKLAAIKNLYAVKGNKDYSGDESFSPFSYEENCIMRLFGRNLFFTHGHVYNASRLPAVLGEGDALIYGHTHTGGLFCLRKIFIANVGSVCCPRGNVANYLLIDESGITLKTIDGATISSLSF